MSLFRQYDIDDKGMKAYFEYAGVRSLANITIAQLQMCIHQVKINHRQW